MPLAHCSIGTSTNRINLLDETGIHVGDWTPEAGDVEAVFSSSALADYRRLKYHREITTQESIDFTVKKSSQDDIIVAIQDLRRLCRAAMDYWVEGWNDSPVYLAVQASCETNRRYAIIHSAKVPSDNNPFGQPFLQQGNRSVMVQVLLVERGPWLDAAPGTATCIEACAPESYYCWPAYLEFGGIGSDDNVNCGSDADLDDLPSPGGFTVQAWIRADGWGQVNQAHISSKLTATPYGWQFYIDSTNGLCGLIYFGTQDAISYSGTDEFTPDGLWHHVAMTFHPTGFGHTGLIRLWIDGTEVSSYTTQQQGTGVYDSDASADLMIGNAHTLTRDFDGAIGWVHIGVYPWWQSDFTPTPRCEIPDINDNSEGLWIVEGEGSTVYNRADPSANATLTGATWACDCDLSFGRQCGDLEQCFPAYLEFDGGASRAYCGSDAQIQDLPDDGNDFTVDGWIKADGWGGFNAGKIASKENDPTYTVGWYLSVFIGEGLYFFVNGGAGGDGVASSGTDEFSPDGLWHHVTGAVIDTGSPNATLYLAIDGAWVTSYSIRNNKTGNYGNDAGDSLQIGNRADGTFGFDGAIGWMRVSDNDRFGAGVDFTAPPRCTLPDVDANTKGLWISEGHGTYIWNMAGGTPGGTSYTNWACDCDIDVDQSTSCIAQPYIINHLTTSGLTNVHFEDNSLNVWSPNLLYANLPHILLPPVPAANDAVYLGVDTSLADTGPFSSLVFDIGTVQSGVTGRWDYWDGILGWTPLVVQDNTNADGLMTGQAFDTTGIKSVHWLPIDSWAEEDLRTASGDLGAPPVTGWWVRWIVTGVASPTPPWQQNRPIYTISWPYVQIEEDDVPGDIAASLAVELFNESDHDGGTTDPKIWTSRLICGLRSLSRGQDFVAYMNAADEQNPPFITFSKEAAWSWGTSPEVSIGRYILYNVPLSTTSDACEWIIDAGYTRQFYGEYRAFARGYTTGVAGDVSLQIELTYGYGRGSSAISDWVDNQYPLTQTEMFDMGRFVIPPTNWIKAAENSELGIYLRARNNNAGGTRLVRIFDIILIPVDEWAGDFTGTPTSWADFLSGNRSMAEDDWGGLGRYLFIDSITSPKHDIRALSLIRDTGNFTGLVDVVANRPARLRENADQRLWFLAEMHEKTTGNRNSAFEIAHSVQVYNQANYLSMRGDR